MNGVESGLSASSQIENIDGRFSKTKQWLAGLDVPLEGDRELVEEAFDLSVNFRDVLTLSDEDIKDAVEAETCTKETANLILQKRQELIDSYLRFFNGFLKEVLPKIIEWSNQGELIPGYVEEPERTAVSVSAENNPHSQSQGTNEVNNIINQMLASGEPPQILQAIKLLQQGYNRLFRTEYDNIDLRRPIFHDTRPSTYFKDTDIILTPEKISEDDMDKLLKNTKKRLETLPMICQRGQTLSLVPNSSTYLMLYQASSPISSK